MKLRAASPPAWLETALAQPLAVLQDHAHCEKKAAATALSIISAYPDRPELVRAMGALAREEAGHFLRVHDALVARGAALARDEADPYVNALLALMRRNDPGRLMDRLLVAALIEARSHERLELLATHHQDTALRDLYAELARAEIGHAALFVRLAESAGPAEEVRTRMDELLDREAELIARLPVRAAVH